MRKIYVMLMFLLSGVASVAHGKTESIADKTENDYRVYALAKCITNNYHQMGVDFNRLPLTDYTTGFIDIEEGFAFSASENNELDAFITNKTGDFHKPRQSGGDLANVNMVIFDCVDFYHSEELVLFLRDLLQKAESANKK